LPRKTPLMISAMLKMGVKASRRSSDARHDGGRHRDCSASAGRQVVRPVLEPWRSPRLRGTARSSARDRHQHEDATKYDESGTSWQPRIRLMRLNVIAGSRCYDGAISEWTTPPELAADDSRVRARAEQCLHGARSFSPGSCRWRVEALMTENIIGVGQQRAQQQTAALLGRDVRVSATRAS